MYRRESKWWITSRAAPLHATRWMAVKKCIKNGNLHERTGSNSMWMDRSFQTGQQERAWRFVTVLDPRSLLHAGTSLDAQAPWTQNLLQWRRAWPLPSSGHHFRCPWRRTVMKLLRWCNPPPPTCRAMRRVSRIFVNFFRKEMSRSSKSVAKPTL